MSERAKYEHVEGNKRLLCPACHAPMVVSIFIGPQDYTCPTTHTPVTAAQVTAAPAVED